MKINDKRIEGIENGRYFYYVGNQRYFLRETKCKYCGDIFLFRPYKVRGKFQEFCSVSCRAKAPQLNKRREKHWNWKGGKIKDNHGYVQVLLKEKHPRSSRGYVLEHIVKMEKKLGRFLLPSENVHHINGVRDDNRIENLELWSTSQPKGQRVKDKLEYAREIIKIYG